MKKHKTNNPLFFIKFLGALLVVGLFAMILVEGAVSLFGIVNVFSVCMIIVFIGGIYAGYLEINKYLHKKEEEKKKLRKQLMEMARRTKGHPLYDEEYHRNMLFMHNRPAYERLFGEPTVWIEDDQLVTIKTPQKDVN